MAEAPSDTLPMSRRSDGGDGGGAGAGDTIAGRYRILGLLGTGGMGNVYRVYDIELDVFVALKMLHERALDADSLDSFRREVNLARRVTHRNVARTFDIGEHDGKKFLTMELVDGEPLTALLDAGGALPAREILRIAAAICDGLAAAHAAGVVHRDLKPENVMLAAGRVVITDFGIAQAPADAISSGVIAGTPGYMAPEQYAGASDVDARADIYSLGVILFEMATGEPPEGVAGANIAAALADGRVAPPLARVIERCTARHPGDRFSDVSQVAAALAGALADAPPRTAAAAAEPPPRPARTVAVLPFRNVGPAPREYLADGLTDDLIDTLARTPHLRVRPRGMVMQLKSDERDPCEIGRQLGVDVVIEGSLRSAGGALRVSVRAIGVADGFHLWARHYDRTDAELLDVGDEVARAIASALAVRRATEARPAAIDPRALDLYLRARHEYHRYRSQEVKNSISLFEEALAYAPDAPKILSGYAMALVRLSFFAGADAPALRDQARRAAEQAALLGASLGEPHAALAAVNFHSGDVVRAVYDLERALASAPGVGEAHELLGRILVETGRLDEGVQSLTTAVTVEPNLLSARWDLMRAYALLGRWDHTDALLALRNVGETDARPLWLNQVRMSLWRKDRARLAELLRDPVRAADDAPIVRTLRSLCARYLDPGAPRWPPDDAPLPPAGARRLRAWLSQLHAEGCALLGDTDGAIAAFAIAVDAGLLDLAWADACPLLAPLRADPRFAPLRARVAERVRPVLAALDGRADTAYFQTARR